jgi:glycosyltransferase involved in cell wall biosynthesis
MIKDRPRVLEVVPTLLTGGAETLVKDYALLIDKKRIDVVVMCIWGPKNTANEKQLKDASASVIYVTDRIKFPFGRNNILHKTYTKLIIKFATLRELKKIKPDVIHLHLGGFGINKIFVNYAKKRNVKVFFTVHNEPSLFFSRNKSRKWDKKFIEKHPEINLVALNERMRNEINEMFSTKKTLVFRNGINHDRFVKSDIKRRKIREELKIKEGAFVVGHVGRFENQKNHKFLVEIFFEVQKRKTDAILILIGDGSLKAEVGEQIERLGIMDKVHFLTNRSDMPDILNAMDVFLLPSYYEGLPVSLIEAQAVGLRCVVSDTITDECYLTNKVTPLSLNAPIEDWCTAILEPTDKYIAKYSLEDYDMKAVIKKIEQVYLGEIDYL